MSNYHQNIICRGCFQSAPHKAKGLCARCYAQQYHKVYYFSNKQKYQHWQINHIIRLLSTSYTTFDSAIISVDRNAKSDSPKK